jgi:pSer/pThr/pTyr-binding forkhead associated (FHA) protein
MPKFCNNGHQMEDGWTDCPYCVRTGYRANNAGMGKTVLEMDSTRFENQPAAYDGGKTVALSSIKRAPVVGWLVAMNGSQKGEDFRLREGKNSLGTAAGNEVTLRDQAVSQKHANIGYKDGKFMITDLDSTNGTFVNESDEPIARTELKDNDTIRVGETTLKFKCL